MQKSNSKQSDKLDEFILIDQHQIGDKVIPEFKHLDGKVLIKHFIGTNTDNFVLKKGNGNEFRFTFFKINNIYYININGCHIIDYKKFTRIEQVIEQDGGIVIKNKTFGKIMIPNCEIDLFKKGLDIMDDFIKMRTSFWKDLAYSLFN